MNIVWGASDSQPPVACTSWLHLSRCLLSKVTKRQRQIAIVENWVGWRNGPDDFYV